MASGMYLEALTSYYSKLAFDALGMMQGTRNDLRDGTFSCERTFGKAVSLWLDATEGWWSALLVSASAPVPTVLLRISGEDTTDAYPVYMSVPGTTDPEKTDLLQLGGTGIIPRENIVVEVAAGRDRLDTRLKGLAKLSLPDGLYQGLLHSGQKPLVILLAQVER